MILQLRHGAIRYEVEVPGGCRVVPSSSGLPVLVVPGARPEDTATWLPAPEIVPAARLGSYGLALRSARPVAVPRPAARTVPAR